MSLWRLGKMLRELRETKGMSQVNLAEKARVSQAYIAMLESGEKRNPSLVILRRLANALGVPVIEILK